jgi:mono/diheme cytochrome c family protein
VIGGADTLRRLDRLSRWLTLAMTLVAGTFAAAAARAHAQDAQSGEAARTIERGKDIFKTKATCQFCHKWDASGDQGYGGNALSLRQTKLTPDQVAETIKCGRPGTGMPFHDQFAYSDRRCYGVTRAELGNDMPPEPNAFLNQEEIDAVVKYLFAKVIGRGPSTYEDCVEFWGAATRQCEPMKK